jgi:hypothetical protein
MKILLARLSTSHWLTGAALATTLAGCMNATDDRDEALGESTAEILGHDDHVEKFGAAAVAGDFDCDGIDDVAVGAPLEAPTGTTVNTGAVYLFKGTTFGLVPWDRLDPKALNPDVKDNDRFGFSLAAADFNGDHCVDLVVGAPLTDVHGAVDAGAVYLYLGAPQGPGHDPLHKSTEMTQATGGAGQPNEGDHFGWALAVGRLDDDSRPDLAVGIPGEAIGSSSDRLGWVNTFAWSQINQGFLAHKGLGRPASTSPRHNDRFGFSLAIGDLDDSGVDELVVGAPGWSDTTGDVFEFGNMATTPTLQTWIPDSGVGAHFGWSLAVGKFDRRAYGSGALGVRDPNDRRVELAIGVPDGETSGGDDEGFVKIYEPEFDGPFGLFSGLTWQKTIHGGVEGYGRVLHSIALSNANDLAIGAPEADSTTLVETGRVEIFGAPGTSFQRLTAVAPGSVPQALDHFGSAIASGSFSAANDVDLVVGMPGRHQNSGAIIELLDVNQTPLRVLFDQESP